MLCLTFCGKAALRDPMVCQDNEVVDKQHQLGNNRESASRNVRPSARTQAGGFRKLKVGKAPASLNTRRYYYGLLVRSRR